LANYSTVCAPRLAKIRTGACRPALKNDNLDNAVCTLDWREDRAAIGYACEFQGMRADGGRAD
tara:strand:- start:2153 stop:2341 length:189 start_codon:yes stop_codon:yes gene_type:complete